MPPRLTAIIATIGHSPWLRPCLEAVRRDGGREVEIVLVDQGEVPCQLPAELVDATLRLDDNRGFAVANNLAAARSEAPFVATINDDVLIEEGWSRHLLREIERRPTTAAVQGINLQLRLPVAAAAARLPGPEMPEIVDGCGIGWNAAWQAVQLRRGELAPRSSEPLEIFGVSATAAIYRRAALASLGNDLPQLFDERLRSYYEDVDLACRLRRAGFEAWLVPAARAHHAGSWSGRRLPLAGLPLIYGNRYLVLARWLGRGFWRRLPGAWLRDLKDLAAAAAAGEGRRVTGIVAGWSRALRLLPRYLHTAPTPLIARSTP